MKPGIPWKELQAIHERYPIDEADVRAMLARVPPSWKLITSSEDGGLFKRGSVQVILSLSVEEDQNLWVYVSACGRTRPDRFFLPTWEDLKRVKNDFIGPDRPAYQVFPPEAQYVNLHPCVLHLWARLDGSPALPDFTRGLGTI